MVVVNDSFAECSEADAVTVSAVYTGRANGTGGGC